MAQPPENTQAVVAIETYGGEIETFFSKVSLLRLKTLPLVLPHHELPWKYIDEVKRTNGFPSAKATSLENEGKAAEANEIIAILNSTEDFLVFKIAMNKLLALVRGRTAGPFYRGEDYTPEKLSQALAESDR